MARVITVNRTDAEWLLDLLLGIESFDTNGTRAELCKQIVDRFGMSHSYVMNNWQTQWAKESYMRELLSSNPEYILSVRSLRL